METKINPVLAGRKALVVGVANDQSIAYGCAKAFRAAGADLAITWLNEKAQPHVEPLARELEASITAALDVSKPGELEAVFEKIEKKVGTSRPPGAFDRLRAQSRSTRRPPRLLRGGVRQGDGHFMSFVHSHGEARRAAHDRRRRYVRDELRRRE